MFEKGFYSINLILGLLWLRSSLGKITGGKFVDTLGPTLSKIAPTNPYPFFKSFLQSVAIPNALIFGQLSMWGEFLTALSIILASAYLIFFNSKNGLMTLLLIAGLLGGMFLNTIFWFGFGYTNVSTDGLNLLMFLIELVGVVVLLNILRMA